MGSKPMVAPTSTPSAWIVTNNRKDKSQPSDKGRKSVKNGKVYLDDGQEFEIELYNPLTECVLCDIKLNGQSISKNGLVLRPAQRFYLDCFIDDKKKFVFSTYEVEDTIETSDSIAKNGLLEVFFYKEDVVQISDWRRRFDRVIVERHYYPTYPYWTTYPNIYYGYPYNTVTIGNGTGAIGLTTNTYSGTTLNSARGSAIGSTTTTSVNDNGSLFSSNSNTSNALYSSNANISNTSNNVTLTGSLLGGMESTPISSSLNANIETGRVEKGTASSQKFKEVDMQFQSMYISQTILQILPTSVKPVEVKELVKVNDEDGTITIKKDSNDVIELIKKLADLHTAGILTDDEFNNKKAELLSKI
jgi:hypothetical protein